MTAAAPIIIDSEFHALIPPITADERQQLEANLRKDGCRDPLVRWAGHDILLDGHNRYEICKSHNVEFRTVDIDLPTRHDAVVWVIRNQFGRRNLPLYERARLALKLKPVLVEQAKVNQRQSEGRGQKGLTNSSNLKPVNVRREIAAASSVSQNTIAKVERIERTAVEPLRQLAASGKVSVNAAAAVAKLSTIHQRAVLASGAAAVKAKAAEEVLKVKAKRKDEPLPNPREYKEKSPQWRWTESMTRLRQYMQQAEQAGWFERKVEVWSANEKSNAVRELVKLRDELNAWITTLETSHAA